MFIHGLAKYKTQFYIIYTTAGLWSISLHQLSHHHLLSSRLAAFVISSTAFYTVLTIFFLLMFTHLFNLFKLVTTCCSLSLQIRVSSGLCCSKKPSACPQPVYTKWSLEIIPVDTSTIPWNHCPFMFCTTSMYFAATPDLAFMYIHIYLAH